MAKLITLKHDTECRECGTFLAAGTKAKWYGRGVVYGLTCHSYREKINDLYDAGSGRFGVDEFYAETGLRLDNLND